MAGGAAQRVGPHTQRSTLPASDLDSRTKNRISMCARLSLYLWGRLRRAKRSTLPFGRPMPIGRHTRALASQRHKGERQNVAEDVVRINRCFGRG